AEDGIRDRNVTGVQTCALPIWAVESGSGEDGVDSRRAASAAAIAATTWGSGPSPAARHSRKAFAGSGNSTYDSTSSSPCARWPKIGRASCRERVGVGGGGGGVE